MKTINYLNLNIDQSIKHFKDSYVYLECETHVLKSDLHDDYDNTATEYELFETLRQHVLKTNTVTDDELVTDFYMNDGVIKVRVHNLETDNKRLFVLEDTGIIKSEYLNEV
ncbi:hypothetical protein [Mammaliicoccus sciuri]|uniref:hypothetical protein n=1 Tax=Mammaliicoccus sciuri TaxID=1296 RepID=UPI002B25D07D|nr:hypothetical protein [Mammaliicoccus sciuri]WQK75194.1 hypothetical protein P3U33_05550 [Mammaliicoccus sciuri]